jgi:tetratricopeptide (TPR) repeat protein
MKNGGSRIRPRAVLGPRRAEMYDTVTFYPGSDTQTEWAMLRTITFPFLVLSIACAAPFRAAFPAQQPVAGDQLGGRGLPGTGGLNAVVATAQLEIHVQEATGAPVEGVAVVTLTNLAGQFYRQGTTKAGYITFNNVAPTEYTVQVVAPAYDRAVKQVDASGNQSTRVIIVLQRGSGDTTLAAQLASMTPKAQKEMAKAIGALRANRPAIARSHLDAANRMAPNQAEVSYLFGVYSSQLGDAAQARSYWTRTLELYPNHVRALLSLSEILIREKKPGQAAEYMKRAIEAEPSSWRPHAILAEAYYLQHSRDEAIKEAERAVELGRGQAAIIEPLLAQCLAERGEKDRAIRILQTYGQDHPEDASAKKQLASLLNPQTLIASNDAAVSINEMDPSAMATAAEPLPVASGWLPPDVDDKMPPVEPGAACALDEVVQNAGKRLQELVKNVDRFTATELVTDESLNKWGFPSSPEKAQFDYIVSMEETRRGALSVEEYRERRNSSKGFPEAVTTSGLPALVVIFHPYYAGSYEMTCEGLARWNGGLAWQVHFRQRKDKPNTIRSYRNGPQGQGYPVALKGRAWIAADNYQIVRLETNMVAPMPQIRLAAEHVNIEYAPVRFRKGTLEMWLPASVEVYSDWKGHRVHRRHRFSNYLLFSVDDQQKISAPKGHETPAPDSEQPN